MTQNNKTNRMTVFIQNNKNLLIALAAIVIVVLLAIMLPRMTRRDEAVAPEETTETTDTTTGTMSMPVNNNPAGEAAYKAAIADHEGQLITVMDGCVAEPKTQEVTAGEHVLLVNASGTPHTFTVGTDSYTVGERHYKTLRMKTVGEYKISCDETKDIATISVK